MRFSFPIFGSIPWWFADPLPALSFSLGQARSRERSKLLAQAVPSVVPREGVRVAEQPLRIASLVRFAGRTARASSLLRVEDGLDAS
jgi:hypothetical protein